MKCSKCTMEKIIKGGVFFYLSWVLSGKLQWQFCHEELEAFMTSTFFSNLEEFANFALFTSPYKELETRKFSLEEFFKRFLSNLFLSLFEKVYHSIFPPTWTQSAENGHDMSFNFCVCPFVQLFIFLFVRSFNFFVCPFVQLFIFLFVRSFNFCVCTFVHFLLLSIIFCFYLSFHIRVQLPFLLGN
jgi:hypothetical protein